MQNGDTLIRSVQIFADGENLVCRFQELLLAGRKPVSDVVHEKDTFVWCPQLTAWTLMDVRRVNYYTSVVGDHDRVRATGDQIGRLLYRCEDGQRVGKASIVPHVFKKESRERRSRLVDIQLTLDAVHAAKENRIDAVMILSGDGDFLPVVREIRRTGCQAFVGAFSSGLHGQLPTDADVFLDLDRIFFQSP